MRLPIARSATPQHAPDRHECAISKPTPDTPRLVVIVIVLSLASVQAVLGQPASATLQLLAGAGVIGLELARHFGSTTITLSR